MTKPIASVEVHCGKHCLMVAGLALIVEGDRCWDIEFERHTWTPEMMADAAQRINREVEAKEEMSDRYSEGYDQGYSDGMAAME